jgi:hypothetical protein
MDLPSGLGAGQASANYSDHAGSLTLIFAHLLC